MAPSRLSPSRTIALATGSARPSSRSPRSITVTEEPSAAKTWAISHATTPPPSTTSRWGTVEAAVASMLVHGCASRRPGMSGTAAAVPVARTTATCARYVVPSTSTARSPARRPLPRIRSMPAESSQVLAPLSS